MKTLIMGLLFLWALSHALRAHALDVYNYDANGWFTKTTQALIDVEATKKLGSTQYLLPANATLIAPPSAGANQTPRFVTGAWELQKSPSVALAEAVAAAAATRAARDLEAAQAAAIKDLEKADLVLKLEAAATGDLDDVKAALAAMGAYLDAK